MNSIRVSLSDRSYQIHFGDLKQGFALQLKKLGFLRSSQVFLITSSALQRAGHLKKVQSVLKRTGFRIDVAVLPDGEQHKNIETLKTLYKKGLEAGLDRKSLVVALGGGVVTDLAGFFAATYMRGISYVSIPSTLLAMVDASIGGKTGVDLLQGKNLVGAFWQPRLVWTDSTLLQTLPLREWRTGFAEIIKYGIIKDAAFFRWLQSKITTQRDMSRWANEDVHKALFRSAQIKAQVVSRDEREKPLAGGREILNFGHTTGHALEAAFGYKTLSHGEAISIGMNVAGRIALQKGTWSAADHRKMLELLTQAGLPTRVPVLSGPRKKIFWSALSNDKKNISGQLRFVLPERIGRVSVRSGISHNIVQKAFHS